MGEERTGNRKEYAYTTTLETRGSREENVGESGVWYRERDRERLLVPGGIQNRSSSVICFTMSC